MNGVIFMAAKLIDLIEALRQAMHALYEYGAPQSQIMAISVLLDYYIVRYQRYQLATWQREQNAR